MNDDDGFGEAPDFWDPTAECLAHRTQKGVIGATPPHAHTCRQFPEHAPPHVCHACGATWTHTTAAVTT